MTTTAPSRVVTLDIVRGVAVMGILAMNIVAFAMPPQAYVNPMAYGTQSVLDLAVYAFNFVFVDGKMRGLFSLLFGASMLLVIQRAEASDRWGDGVVFRRQLWLLAFGLIHFYFIWYGDILTGYALIGMVAWLFHRKSVVSLVTIGIALVAAQFAILAGIAFMVHSLAPAIAAGTADAATVSTWDELTRDLADPTPERLQEILALYRGPWSGVVEQQLTDHLFMPLLFTFVFGWETLAYMLFGMAALKSGFLAGAWSNRAYVRVAAVGFAISVPVYCVLAWLIFASRFSVEALYAYSFAATVPVRPVMVAAFAALIILSTTRGGGLVDLIAAAGRAAFTNYLGTSILMTGLFFGWGFGLFGTLSRAELYLVVFAMWALMLLWSKPWLDRFAYGPLEWLWRSLARWELQPMRKRVRGAAPVAR